MVQQLTQRSAAKSDNRNQVDATSQGAVPRKKKDVVRAERTMTDNVLTATFLSLIALVFFHVRNDAYWLKFVIGSLAGVSVVIYVSKKVAVIVGTFLSDVVLNTSWQPLEDRRPLRKKQTIKKFKDQAWQVCFWSQGEFSFSEMLGTHRASFCHWFLLITSLLIRY